MNEPNQTFCRITMNGVDIGTIGADEYRAIRQKVLHDPRRWAEQLGNLVGATARLVSEMLVGVPAITFWVVFLMAGFGVDTGEMLVKLLQPSERDQLFEFVFTMAIAYAALLLMTALAFGKNWGVRNTLQSAIGDMIRQKLAIPTAGDIRVSCFGHIQGAARIGR